MRICFMGTPDFAATCLARLLEDGHDIVGVFTQPDKPRGRGHQLASPTVKRLALEKGLPVFQPLSMKDGQALDILRELAPQIIVVVAYGRILPREVLDLPPLGCINVHASLLPRWRGAAPIQWSVLAGDKETGVTIMALDEGMDTGDMLATASTPIGPEETAGDLFERLAPLGAGLLSETLPLLEKGICPRQKQDETKATHAPMLRKEMGEIDFTRSAMEIHNQIRGMYPAPGAFIRKGDVQLKVLQAAVVDGFAGNPGALLHHRRLIVACGTGAVELLSVCPPSKKPMDGAAFLNGGGAAFFAP